jgi:hypothetical protein
MQRRICLVLAVGMVLGAAVTRANGEVREWRDVTGQHTRQAEFVALVDGEVQLKLADGRSATVPLERLSVADRTFIAEVTEPKASDPFVTLASNDVKMVQAVLQSPRVAQAETIPPPDASATFAAMQEAEVMAGNEAVDYRRIRKFVYYGCYSTTHLIDFGPQSGVGTIHYCLGHHHHDHCHGSCCGPHCTWHLAYLRKISEDNFFFYYRPFFADPTIDRWAFAKRPWCGGGCKYRIWYRLAATRQWVRFDCASRVHPK